MSREDAPFTGYVVECDRQDETWILGGHCEQGFRTFVLTQATAEHIARALSDEYATQFHVVPAPGHHADPEEERDDGGGFFFFFGL